MKLVWLGHAGFRLEIEKAVILIDPWFSGNPSFPEGREDEATAGVTHLLITHGHGDHTADALALSKRLGIPLVGIADLIGWWSTSEGIDGIGFNKGGTVDLNGAKVTMVNAVHSSSVQTENGPVYTGTEAGYMIVGDGHTIYVSGDTDIMADMEWMGDYHKPDIGILACGGFYTMDMDRAAYAAKRWFDFKTVIPCHYKTFPGLAQSAQPLIDALPDVRVIEPELLTPIEI